jgi:SAM-dependent methyltransferase
MNDPIALETYEAIAEAYAARVDTKAHNAYYDRPAMLSLLPSVNGQMVLDAGCGPGSYTEWLVEHGAADVIGVDVSPKMVKLATERLKGRARIVQADFRQRLDFLEDQSRDLVISALAMDYVRGWLEIFKDFHRVLRPGGHMVFSVQHPAPLFFQTHSEGNYFDIEEVSYIWRGFGTIIAMPYYRRSLTQMINPLIDAGFILECMLEPRPVPEFRERDPEEYEKLMRQPGFICFRGRKIGTE